MGEKILRLLTPRTDSSHAAPGEGHGVFDKSSMHSDPPSHSPVIVNEYRGLTWIANTLLPCSTRAGLYWCCEFIAPHYMFLPDFRRRFSRPLFDQITFQSIDPIQYPTQLLPQVTPFHSSERVTCTTRTATTLARSWGFVRTADIDEATEPLLHLLVLLDGIGYGNSACQQLTAHEKRLLVLVRLLLSESSPTCPHDEINTRTLTFIGQDSSSN